MWITYLQCTGIEADLYLTNSGSSDDEGERPKTPDIDRTLVAIDVFTDSGATASCHSDDPVLLAGASQKEYSDNSD